MCKWKKPHSVIICVVFGVHWFFNVPGWHNKNCWTLQPFKLGVQDEAQPRKWSRMIYYFICFPLLLLFRMAQKVPGLTKYTFQQGSLTCQKKIIVQARSLLLEISYWALLMTLYCALQYSLIMYLSIKAFAWWFHFYWFIYIDKKNFKRVK